MTSGGFSNKYYRPNFDVSIPVYSPVAADLKITRSTENRTWLIISSQSNIHDEMLDYLIDIAMEHPSFLALSRCSNAVLNTRLRCRQSEIYSYPDVLKVSESVNEFL